MTRWLIGLLLLLLALTAACGDDARNPLIEAILPPHAAPGELVDIVGERFGGGAHQVSFGGSAAEVMLWQDRRVRVEVPSGASGLTVVVLTVDGMPSNAVSFTVD